MTDLSAYRERFPAVGAWTRWAHENLAPEQRTIEGGIARADSALTALAKALGEAEEDARQARIGISEIDAYLKEAVREAEAERDLAIAHDRQPYPTAYAYEMLCEAYNHWRDRAEKAEAINDQWEVKAADLMRERNEAKAEARTEVLDSAWNTANERSEKLAAELAELKARRCEGCRKSGQCGIERAWAGLTDFACNRYERREG